MRLDNESGYIISRGIRGIEHIINIFGTPQVTAGILQAKTAAIAIGIGMATHEEIDLHGIVNATRLAMCSAVAKLVRRPDSLLIDAVTLPKLTIPQKSFIRGDNISLSIAAASIVAKVARDRMMRDYDLTYPGYGFARHKGYPTTEHFRALKILGPCPKIPTAMNNWPG